MARSGPRVLQVRPCGCRYCEPAGAGLVRLWTAHRPLPGRVIGGRRAHVRNRVTYTGLQCRSRWPLALRHLVLVDPERRTFLRDVNRSIWGHA